MLIFSLCIWTVDIMQDWDIVSILKLKFQQIKHNIERNCIEQTCTYQNFLYSTFLCRNTVLVSNGIVGRLKTILKKVHNLPESICTEPITAFMVPVPELISLNITTKTENNILVIKEKIQAIMKQVYGSTTHRSDWTTEIT